MPAGFHIIFYQQILNLSCAELLQIKIYNIFLNSSNFLASYIKHVTKLYYDMQLWQKIISTHFPENYSINTILKMHTTSAVG